MNSFVRHGLSGICANAMNFFTKLVFAIFVLFVIPNTSSWVMVSDSMLGWKRSRTFLLRTAGQELVEFALILPILLALLLGIMELSVAVLNYNTMSNAAREAAHTGTLTRNESEIRSSGLRLTSATPLTNANITINWLDDSNTVVPSAEATKLRVTIAQNYHLLTGGLLMSFGFNTTIPMTATSTMTVE